MGVMLAGAAVAASPPRAHRGGPVLASRASTSSTTAEIPVEIRGREVKYTGKAGLAHFTGGVAVVRGSATLVSDELDTIQGAEEAIARGHVRLFDGERMLDLVCDEAHYTHGLARVEASGHCRLFSGAGSDLSTVTADSMEVLVDTREALAHGSVRIVQGDDEAVCTDAHLFGAESRVVLTGRPVLKRPPHEFVCDQMTSYFREGRSVLTGSVKGRLAPEHLEDLKREGPGK